jgi:hypothetical protein
MSQLLISREKANASTAGLARLIDTAYGVSVEDRCLARVVDHDLDMTEYSNPVPTPSQRRLMTMMLSLKEVEARNAELEKALREKDWVTVDRHIAEHQEQGHAVNSLTRTSILELHKQLLAASQVLEWTIA